MNTKISFLFFFLIVSFIQANTDRYRLIITDNPATTITIGWDQLSGDNPIVYYGTTDYGTNYTNYSLSKKPTRQVNYKYMNNTFVKLTNLRPNANYYFIIKDSEGISKRFWFRTAPSTNSKMSFIAGGDSRNFRQTRRNANLLVSKLKPTAVFFGGDMTAGDSGREWQGWFNDWQLTTAPDGRMFPIIPARGNHEGSNESITKLFDIPSSSVYYRTVFGENLYSIYTLNSEIYAGGSQAYWLKNQLKSDNSIWKSAQYHKPMRPHVGSKSEGNDEYTNWARIFYQHKVDLVYESDSHTAKSTWPIKPCNGYNNCDSGFTRDDKNGTVYVGEGCWGAPLRGANDKKKWTRDAGSFNQFKWVFVSEDKIELRTVKVDNAQSVTALSNNDSFQIPNGLDIWKPSNGSLITITKKSTDITSCTNLPYFQSFESANHGWNQSAMNDFDWRLQSGGTFSMMTGPDGASNGSKYMYVEASMPNYPNKNTYLVSPCFTIKTTTSVSFDYHMRGSKTAMGKLELQIRKPNAKWKTIWVKKGYQGDKWLTATIDIQKEYFTKGVQFRFYGKTGTSWQGDIAIDNFLIDKPTGLTNSVARNTTINEDITIHPNPVGDILYISTPSATEDIQVTITDFKGIPVINGNSRTVTTSSLSKGIYFINIKNSKGYIISRKRFIKK